MRGNKPYSPDDDNFEVIFKELRAEEAYTDLSFGEEDVSPTVTEDGVGSIEEEAVETPEDDWKDVTEDFLIGDVKVAENDTETVSEDIPPVDDVSDGSDADFEDVDRAEIDLELNETISVDETESSTVEPAWEEKPVTDVEAELEAADDAALIEIVRQRVGTGESSLPLDVLIHQLGLEDQVGLEDDLNTDVDDLGEEEMTGMELDLSFEDEDDDENK